MNEKRTLDPNRIGFDTSKFCESLQTKIIGQDEAIEALSMFYQIYRVEMAVPGRPLASLLFLGPTGTGKTRMVEAIAESIHGDAKSVIPIDCAEYQHSHEIAKILGPPPGYLGHRETHPLINQERLNSYHTPKDKISFVLFDEIEKASDALWNLLLGILDKGRLTTGDNRLVDFSRAMIFMTSNLGASQMDKILRPPMGFNTGRTVNGEEDSLKKLDSKIEKTGKHAVRKRFSPEFVNRMDRVIVFRSLNRPELSRILEIELSAVQSRIKNRGIGTLQFTFRLTLEAKEYLLDEGTDPVYGARHLKRAVERLLVLPLSSILESGQIRQNDQVLVDYDNKKLTFVSEELFYESASFDHKTKKANA